MPRFETIPVAEAQLQSATGRRAEIIREYGRYLSAVSAGDAGKLQASGGESPTAVRRRLGAAAKAVGKEIVIRRSGDTIYFWLQVGSPRRRRRRS